MREVILVDDSVYGNIAVTIANKCREEWQQFYAEKRSVYVAIHRKPGCTRADMEHGNVGSWPVMEF